MISLSVMVKLYEKGLSTTQVARAVGLSQTQTTHRLRKAGVAMRPSGGSAPRLSDEEIRGIILKYTAEKPRETFEQMNARMKRGFDYVTAQDKKDMDDLPKAEAAAFNPRRLPPSAPLWRNVGDI